jgi:hypothetical protein
VGTVPQRGLLVHVAKFGYQDTLTTEGTEVHRGTQFSFSIRGHLPFAGFHLADGLHGS